MAEQHRPRAVVNPASKVSRAERERARGCRVRPELPACAIVIFGASGDLTARKLFPALYSLYAKGRFPDEFVIVGCARSEMGDEGFREKMRTAMEDHGSIDSDVWERMASRLFFHRMEYDSQEGYVSLSERIETLDREHGTNGNRLFYLAVPPTLYPVIAEHLGRAGMAAREGTQGFSRMVVEKPFGHDLSSARELDRTLHQYFSEDQIFRIDHYLAKETVQNILMLRFANAIFEPVWNRTHVEYVSIIAAESLGVGHRAGYYDKAGVLRDMFQNHMMQLLALSAMGPPTRFYADRVRDEKTRLYRSLRPFDVSREFEDIVLGQYGPGESGGEPVPGYREEPSIAPDSTTPTFAMIRAFVDNWRWQGVPFYITSGKRLKSKISRIVVQFKEVPHSILRDVVQEQIAANRLFLGIYPDEVIHMSFMSKVPAPSLCLEPVIMHYGFENADFGEKLEAYEKVLVDCILGDQMLFWRQDGVELTWGFLTPILEMCEECSDLKRHLHTYPAGSWGPEPACDLHPGYFRDVQNEIS
ncbi:MAG: glucose-6-phosphate dehydrogenase [Desulfovibrionales bacterium]